MKRFLLISFIVPLSAALSSCSSGGGSSGSSGFVARSEPTTLTSAPPTTPVSGAGAQMVVDMPGPIGTVRKTREKSYPNGVFQQGVLDEGRGGHGENHVEVAVLTRAPSSARGMLNIGPPSEDSIRREILKRYPKVSMRIVAEPRQNAIGVFGLAIGRAGDGARCIFAWQWADDISGGRAPAPMSLRVHLCRRDATVDELAAVVEGMTLAPPEIVAQALDDSRTTIPVTAVGAGGLDRSDAVPEGRLEAALGPARQPQAQPTRYAKARRHAQPTRYARRKAAPSEDSPDQGVTPVAQQAYQSAGGPRYLAPVSGQTAQIGGAPTGGAPMTRQLDANLPAAAYRGPTGR